MFYQKKKPALPRLLYEDHSLQWVEDFKYLGVTFTKSNNLSDGLETLCQQARRAQTVLDLHILKHKTVSVKYIFDLFDTLIKPILLYGSEVYGINNYNTLETFYLKFIKIILDIKKSTNICMVLSETGRYPLSIEIKVNMIKFWMKIVNSEMDKLIYLAYKGMLTNSIHTNKSTCWTSYIKELLFSAGFGYIWEQQSVDNVNNL